MESVIVLHSDDETMRAFGSLDQNLRLAESQFHVKISARNQRLKITGNQQNVKQAVHFFEELLQAPEKVAKKTNGEAESEEKPKVKGSKEEIHFFHKGKLISPRSKHQAAYLKAISDYDIVIWRRSSCSINDISMSIWVCSG